MRAKIGLELEIPKGEIQDLEELFGVGVSSYLEGALEQLFNCEARLEDVGLKGYKLVKIYVGHKLLL